MRYVGAASLSALTALSLAAGLTARYVPPATVWWPQLAALALPVTGAVAVPSAVWSWRTAGRAGGGTRRLVARSLSVLQGALVVLACAPTVADRLPPVAGPGQSEPGREGGGAGGEEPLTVVSLNAGKAPAHSGPLADFLRDTRPDIVALQETSVRLVPAAGVPGGVAMATTSGASALATQTAYRLASPDIEADGLPERGEVVRDPIFVREGGVDVPSPDPAVPQGDVSVRLGVEESSGTFTRSVVEWGGQAIAVYSVHLRSFGAWRSAERPDSLVGLARYVRRALAGFREDLVHRAAEAERLRAFLDAEPLPYIVAGDLNSTPAQWAYRRIAQGHLDVLAVKGRGLSLTFPSRTPVVRIDAIFASPEFHVTGAAVGPPGLSDHRPVVARVMFRRPSSSGSV